jgi:NADH dehydrogenase
MSATGSQKLDIVILGGGFAGVYCAKTLGKELRGKSAGQAGLISEENYMVFQPMLPEVAGSSISPRHVVNPLRLLCRDVRVLKGAIEKIIWPERKLILNAGAFSGNVEIQFKHLVLALGAVVDLSRIPGMPEHAYLMRNVGDAMMLRTTIIGRIEEANLEPRPEVKRRLLSFVVVGGGYSGVETAGQILDLLRSIQRYYPAISRNDWQVHLIHSQDHLLPTLSRRLGEYSAGKLREKGLDLILNQRVKAVTANSVYLEDGSVIATNTVISTVGNAPHPLVTALCQENGFPTEKGRILTEPTCQVAGQSHLWAAGDCAAIPFRKGGFCPATAQFAQRQGILLARNLIRSLQNGSLQSFDFKGMGELASIGHRTAVADILGFTFSGFFAWWLWRTVYLLKLPRLDRKVRVLLDWTLDLFFPRDINLLSPRYSALLKEIHLESGDVLFHMNEPAFSFYIVKSGCVAICDEQGVVKKATAGEYFGERALLTDGVWHFQATATEPSTLVSIPANVFHQIVRGSGSLGRLFQKSAAKYQSREMVEALSRKISSGTGSKRAGDLMQRELRTLKLDMTVHDALLITKAHPHSSYPVVDQTGCVLGVVNREEFYEFIKRPETSPETNLRELTLATLPTIQENVSVCEMMELLVRSGSNKLLVLHADQRLAGIITVMDLLTAAKS